MPNEQLERAVYPFPPIGSPIALARMLRCSLADLARVESTADRLYHEVRLTKKDGGLRICYDAKPPLKGMQARIQCMILKKVTYPSYLMGGLADRGNPRDYVRNAQFHSGARVLINEDLANFFPSISDRIVFDIFRFFFHFPLDVTRTLTSLTTRMGGVPQGSKTSSYLANLAFWACEPVLVAKLQSMGFTYTATSTILRSPRRPTRHPKRSTKRYRFWRRWLDAMGSS